MEFNLTQGGQWLKRTSFTGINADVIVADVLPDAVADAIDPIRPFLPTSISGGFESGDVVRAELLPGPARPRLDGERRDDLGHAPRRNDGKRLGAPHQTPISCRPEAATIASARAFARPLRRRRRTSCAAAIWQFGAGLSMIETDDTIARRPQHAKRNRAARLGRLCA